MAQHVEKLIVNNFAGITQAEIEFGRLTVLIGPQASGKSVCAKLQFFAKQVVARLPAFLAEHADSTHVTKKSVELFLKYFPRVSWHSRPFDIRYEYGPLQLHIYGSSDKSFDLNVDYSPYFHDLVADLIGELFFSEDNKATVQWFRDRLDQDGLTTLSSVHNYIPAGRSFYSYFDDESLLTLLASDIDLDPFLIEFSRLYSRVRASYDIRINPKIKRRVEILLSGKYVRKSSADYIEATDGRATPLNLCSSGQQEALPLAITLSHVTLPQARLTFVVEEPEAHLFPSAQRNIVHLLASTAGLGDLDSSTQYVVTTHSPYILTAVNNLMYGGKIVRDTPEKAAAVRKILGDTEVIDPDNVTAYLMENGTAKSIVNPETSLIKASVIDAVSGELAAEFDKLLDIAFEEKAA